MKDKGVPVGAGGDLCFDGDSGAGEFDAFGEIDLEDEAGIACVGDDKVGASTEREDGQVLAAGEGDRFEQVGFGGDARQEAGRASDAEGGEGGERDVLFKVHRVKD